MSAIVQDKDGYVLAEVVGDSVLTGAPPRHHGQMYSGGYGFHECIPKRYIDAAEGRTGLHCDICGFIWTNEPLQRRRIPLDTTCSSADALATHQRGLVKGPQ